MNKLMSFIIGFIILAFAISLQLTSIESINNITSRLESLVYDMELRTLLLKNKKITDTQVAVVDIDDKSLQRIGRWPWSRSKLVELAQRIQEEGAAVIAFDMFFPAPEENASDIISSELNKQKINNPRIRSAIEKIKPFLDYDKKFSESLESMDSVLGITFTYKKETIGAPPIPLFTLKTPSEKQLGFIIAAGYIGSIPILQSAAKHEGFVNVFPDSDGIIRRVPMVLRYKDTIYPSLALEAVRLFLFSKVELVTENYGDASRVEGVRVGDHYIPTDTKSQAIIPFIGNSFSFPFYSASDVLDKKIPSDALRGKIVFIGASAVGLSDLRATAIQTIYPGVEIHATIAHGILKNTFSYKPSWSLGAEIASTLVLGIIFIFIFPYLGARILGLLIFIIPVVIFFINTEIWKRTGLIISIFIPTILSTVLALINILNGYIFETMRRERLKEMFGQYVPEKHIDYMLKVSGKEYALQGEDREMTVLFADIRNFTAISEPLSVLQLKDLLNEFFTPMTEIIFRHRGTIDKYVGDLIMAFWGAPLKDKQHVQHAISAAIDMQRAVTELQTAFAKRNLPKIEVGIGLNSGTMSVGDMGSKFRRNYTVLGDAVNLASRIESLTKFYGVKIMTTESTILEQKLFVFRQIDRVLVKGKKEVITLYEIICRQAELTQEISAEIKLSEHAIQLYLNQEWEKAFHLFTELNTLYPHVKLYTIYLSRISEMTKAPLPADWSGVYIHTEK